MAMFELFKGGTSNHMVQITWLKEALMSRKLFPVFNSWFDKQEVREIIDGACRISPVGNQLFKLMVKLKNVKLHLKMDP